MNRFLAVMLAVVVSAHLAGGPAHAQFFCGDVNADGKENIADVTYGFSYLFAGGPPPPNFQEADFDRRELYTIIDVVGLVQCVFMCDFPTGVDCANDPLGSATYPAPDTSYKIIHPNQVPANVSTFVLRLNLSQRKWDISGFTLPLEILLDGQPASIDSIVHPEADQPLVDALVSNIHDSGKIVLGAMSILTMPSGAGRFAEIYVTIPISPIPLALDVQWTTLVPKLGPPEDSSLYPAVIGDLFHVTFVPELFASCCALGGDANGDGRVNIGDVVYNIARIFSGGAAPPCNDAADANGDDINNIADVTYLVARIFAGGPAPVCGATGI
ncbi:MAG: dockerin type I repeat-containing protein [Candidatus Zixiibacteriota bacterium]